MQADCYPSILQRTGALRRAEGICDKLPGPLLLILSPVCRQAALTGGALTGGALTGGAFTGGLLGLVCPDTSALEALGC